jgi:histidinol-phosphate aminotransferase
MTDFSSFAAPGINALNPYVPGKPVEELERELGLSDTIKLASNENPLGPSPLGREAAVAVLGKINQYPDDSGFRLKGKLAAGTGLDAGQIVLGAGSSDVIDLVARTFLAPGSNAVFSRYSFAMYPIYTTAAGAECRVAEALPPDHQEMPYGHDLEAMKALVNEDTRVVFIANPNNPTGTWLKQNALHAFLEALPRQVVVVLDEAYTEYVSETDFPDGVAWLNEFPNLIVTRTFSKIYGLAGLRVGYGLGNPGLIALISRVRHPFNVSLPALAAAEAALDDGAFLERSRSNNDRGLAQLATAFDAMGLAHIPSVGNFITVDLQRNGAEAYQRLLAQGVIARPVANYDLPNHLRVTVGTAEQNQRFLEVLEQVLAS